MIQPPAPAELRYLGDLIGDAATLALIEARGGTCIHVPKRPGADCALAREIGLSAVEALAVEWGGNRLKVPTAKRWRALVYRQRGNSYTRICQLLNVTETAVWRWVGRNAPGAEPAMALDFRQEILRF